MALDGIGPLEVTEFLLSVLQPFNRTARRDEKQALHGAGLRELPCRERARAGGAGAQKLRDIKVLELSTRKLDKVMTLETTGSLQP